MEASIVAFFFFFFLPFFLGLNEEAEEFLSSFTLPDTLPPNPLSAAAA